MANGRIESKEDKSCAKATELPSCPITLGTITDLDDPVVCRDGRVYEKPDLAQVIAAKGVSPITREAITDKDYFKCNDLNTLIQCFKELQAELIKEKQKNEVLQQQLALSKILQPSSLTTDSKSQPGDLKTDRVIDESINIVARSNQRIAELEQKQRQMIAEKIALEFVYSRIARKVKEKLTALRQSTKATRNEFHQKLEQHKKNMAALTQAFKPEEEIELTEKKGQTTTEKMITTALAWDETSKQYQTAKNNYKKEFAILMTLEKQRFAKVFPLWVQHKKALAANAEELKLIRMGQAAELNKTLQHSKNQFDSTVTVFGGLQKTTKSVLKSKAEQKGHAEIKKAVDPNAVEALTLKLHAAIDDQKLPDRYALIKQLISNGADVNVIEQKSKCTPLFTAIKQQDLALVELLLNSGAKINTQNLPLVYSVTCRGSCFCHEETCAGCVNQQKIVEVLLRTPDVVIDMRDYHNDTALNWAVYLGKVKICEMLFNNGANPRLKNGFDSDAIGYAQGTTLAHTRIQAIFDRGPQSNAPALSRAR